MNQYLTKSINGTKGYIISPVYSFLNKVIFSTTIARSCSFYVVLEIHICVCVYAFICFFFLISLMPLPTVVLCFS